MKQWKSALAVIAMSAVIAGCAGDRQQPDWQRGRRDGGAAAAPAAVDGDGGAVLPLDGAWALEQTRPIVEKTLTVRLAPELAAPHRRPRTGPDVLAAGTISSEHSSGSACRLRSEAYN